MDQHEIWDDLVGDSWVRNADVIDRHSAPFGDAAMDRLGDITGARVLDVGCGTGTTTRQLARRGAIALGVDLSSRMIAHARLVETTDRSGARFAEADATEMDTDEPFDAIYSRFGVMFFDDLTAGFDRLRKLVAPEGRLAFASWGGPFDNPWMTTAVMASVPVLGPPELPGPEEPGPFSLATPDRVRAVLEAAGWADVQAEPLTIEGPRRRRRRGGPPPDRERAAAGRRPGPLAGLGTRTARRGGRRPPSQRARRRGPPHGQRRHRERARLTRLPPAPTAGRGARRGSSASMGARSAVEGT